MIVARVQVRGPWLIIALLALAIVATMVIGAGVKRLIGRIPLVHTRERTDQRAKTLTTVLRSALIAALWIVITVTMLSELNVNIGAFVATATLIGGAIAFGAQFFVRDLIAGIYVLAEDQYGVGDVVDLGLATGTVEKITLRSTRLRDGEGRVWWVGNGQITRVANLTQGFANAVVDAAFPLTADVNDTISTLAGLVAPHGAEVLGVQDVSDDRFVLRITARTAPGGQFDLRRTLRATLADAYREGVLPMPAASGPTVIVMGQAAPEPGA